MTNIHTLSGPEHSPLSGEAPQQLVILLHGLGSDGNDLIGLVPAMINYLPYAHFIAPHAPFACDMAPFGYQWFSLQDRSAPAVVAGVQQAAPIVSAFIDEQKERFGLEDNQIALVGFSQGTMMSLYVGLRRADALGAILGYSGALVAPQLLASEIESRPPVCLVHGTDDDVVPYQQLLDAKAALEEVGVGVEAHTCHGLGHSIDPYGMEAGVKFLQQSIH